MKKHIAHTLLKKAKSRQEFYHSLAKLDLHIYTTRSGLIQGIQEGSSGRKHSFQSLSIKPEQLQLLDQKAELFQVKERLNRLEQMRNRGKERDNELER